MSNKRKNYTENQYLILHNEVDGLCPLCTIPLIYEKANKLNKRVNLAHIYPHSPTEEEKELLKSVERLFSSNVDEIKNIIWLCPNCHEKFDKPRTLDGYNNLMNIKKNLLKNREIAKEFNSYKIEEEIKQVLQLLTNYEDEENENISLVYDPKTIDNKTNSTISNLTKRKIKNHVREFFNIIKKEFKYIDSVKPNKATKIAIQIKAFYNEALEVNTNQEAIYSYLVEWLDKKTNISEDASSIVISYFVQDCEVFDAISK